MPALQTPDITKTPKASEQDGKGKWEWLKKAKNAPSISKKALGEKAKKLKESADLGKVRRALNLLSKPKVAAITTEQPSKISAEETYFQAPEIDLTAAEAQESMESKLENVIKIRRVLGLEQPSEASEAEKRATMDKFYQEKLTEIIQEGHGYTDKVKSPTYKYEYEYEVKDTLMDKAKKAAAVKLLEAKKVANPDQLLTDLKSKSFLQDYSAVLSPTVASNIELLASQLNSEQISAAFKRINELGFPTPQAHNLIGNRSFYEGLIKIGKADDQTYQKICQELNPYFFLHENSELVRDYNDYKKGRKEVSRTFLTMAQIFEQGGITTEQRTKLDLAQKIALLDHKEPLIETPEKKVHYYDTPKTTIDSVLNNPIDNSILESIVRIAEDRVCSAISNGASDFSFERKFFVDLYYLREKGCLPLLEELSIKGFDIVSNVNRSGEVYGSTEEDKQRNIAEIQSAHTLSKDPAKLEWFKLINQIVHPEQPLFTDSMSNYQEIYNNRSKLVDLIDFYSSLNQLPEDLRIPFKSLVEFRGSPPPFEILKYTAQEFKQNMDEYFRQNFSLKGTPVFEYFWFVKTNAFTYERYVPGCKFDQSALPVLAFLAGNIDQANQYVESGEAKVQLFTEVLSGNINLSDKGLNAFLKRPLENYSTVAEIGSESLAANFDRFDANNLVQVIKRNGFNVSNPDILTPEQIQIIDFIKSLDPEVSETIRDYDGKAKDLYSNGQPSMKFVRVLVEKGGKEMNIRAYITPDFLDQPSLSPTDKQFLTLLLNAPNELYMERFLFSMFDRLPEFITEEGLPNAEFFERAAHQSKGSLSNVYIESFNQFLTPELLETMPVAKKEFWKYYLKSSDSLKNLMVKFKYETEQILEKSEGAANIEPYLEVMTLINESPSQEIQRLKNELIGQIVLTENPVESYRQIESVFIKNNLPTAGKVFRVFEIIHPNLQKQMGLLSPVLSQATFEMGDYKRRFDIVFRDLLKVHIFSGNRSLYEYLTFLKDGAAIFDQIEAGQEVSERDRQKASYALKKFKTIKVTSLFGRQDNPEEAQGEITDLKADIQWLRSSLRVKSGQTIVGRVEQMFLKPVGFQNIDQVLSTMASVKKRTTERSLSHVKNGKKDGEDIYLNIVEGDLIKGVEHKYLESILQNGVVAKDYLGSSADSDATPLGTDGTEATKEDAEGGFATAMQASAFGGTGGYGQLGLVFKDRGQFQRTGKTEKAVYDLSKYEVYHTGVVDSVRHKDIRTGLPSTEIDFIVATDTLLSSSKEMENIYFTIAKQGFYIPVTNNQGKVVFTPEVYQEYHKTFNGIEIYDGNPLPVKSLTETDPGFTEIKQLIEVIKADKETTKELSDKVRNVIKEVLNEQDIKLQDEFDTSILGARLYDTGSTGRHTNSPGDYDFDLMLALDNFDFAKSQDIRKALMRKLEPQKDDSHDEGSGYIQIRAKGATTVLPGNPLDIDIGINRKSDLLPFATHDAITEKLKWIRVNLGEDAYYSTIANIVLAKQLLKQGHAYKKVEDGGFGGIGTENWILANNGNLVDAFRSFWETAREDGKAISFDEFKKKYKLLDAGMDLKSNTHDNYVYVMKEPGYQSLLKVAETFLGKAA